MVLMLHNSGVFIDLMVYSYTFNIGAVSYCGCSGSIGDMVLIHSRISACHSQSAHIETVPESSGTS